MIPDINVIPLSTMMGFVLLVKDSMTNQSSSTAKCQLNPLILLVLL